jgi:hypothetical protein
MEREKKREDVFRELMNLRWKRMELVKIFLSERWDRLSEKEKDAIKAQVEELDRKIDALEMQLKAMSE